MKAETQPMGLLVEEEDREDFVVDDFADQFRHAAQSGIEVERGVDPAWATSSKRGSTSEVRTVLRGGWFSQAS